MELDRHKLKEYFEHKQAKSNLILERLTALLERRQAEQEEAVRQFAQLVERHRRLQHAESEARHARSDRRRAEAQLAEAEDRRDAAADRLDQFRRAVVSAQAEVETKTANYHKATDMLKKYMGIEVLRRSKATKESGAVTGVITLTRVDESDPERPFHVLYTSGGSRVTLINTKPSLGDLSDLQAELDDTGNLGLCMAQLRGRFQALAKQQAEKRERRAARAAARAAAPAPPANAQM